MSEAQGVPTMRAEPQAAPQFPPLEWQAKQAAYVEQRRAWDRIQAAVEAERVRLHGACKP